MRTSLRLVAALSVLWAARGAAQAPADPEDGIPSAQEIAVLMEAEPISLEHWPVWRQRYLDWHYDRLSRTREMEEELKRFIRELSAQAQGELPDGLREDHVALHLLGSSLLSDPTQHDRDLIAAEKLFRREAEIAPAFAGAHTGIASALLAQAFFSDLPLDKAAGPSKRKLLREAEQQIRRAESLDSRTRGEGLRGVARYIEEDYELAEKLFARSLQDHPRSANTAQWLARSILSQSNHPEPSEAIARLAEQFPEENGIRAQLTIALVRDGRHASAKDHWQRIRDAGGDPAAFFDKAALADLEWALQTSPSYSEGIKAMKERQYRRAESHFRQAVAEAPDEIKYAHALAHALFTRLQGRDPNGEAIATVRPLVERFPDDGQMQALFAVALAVNGRWGEANQAVQRSRQLGADPSQIVGADTVKRIYEMSQPTLLGRILRGMGIFAGVYAVIIAAMAVSGGALALFTRAVPVSLPNVIDGQVFSSVGERLLFRLYLAALMLGLLFFYAAIPFVCLGVILATLGLLLGVLMLPIIPVQLLVIVAAVGIGLGWSVLKSAFAKSGGGACGLPKSREQCPRLFAAIDEVARRVGTPAVDEVYVAPGSGIGVHQKGRGPFGIFGAKRRVLTLGLSTMHCLTRDELNAILAHEHAHFSHQDTFYSRFIYQVILSIEQALAQMAYSFGTMNYVNPFYWFFYFYYRAYMMLASGFSRSREYLADRMAASIYGKEAFISGLRKVSTEGQLFEMTAHRSVYSLLQEGKAFLNMYDAYRDFRDNEMDPADRERLYSQTLNEKASLFASHPTFQQRVEALSAYPAGVQGASDSALTLFENAQEIEQEMTRFLTDYYQAVIQLQSQAAG